jgi:hypothetical protein
VWYNGDHCFLLTFRYPFTIGDAGEPQMRGQDVFNGVYRVTKIESSFSDGAFTQRLTSHRLALIDILKAFGITGVRAQGQPINPARALQAITGGAVAAPPQQAPGAVAPEPQQEEPLPPARFVSPFSA